MNTSPYALPESLTVGGEDRPIRTDYRCMIDVIRALNDHELDSSERAYIALVITYKDIGFITAENAREAFNAAMWFLSGGERDGSSASEKQDVRLMDWDQDFPLIVAPINKAAGCEVRALTYMHWWTFLSYYREIGECSYSTIVAIRHKIKKHKKLEKWEQEFYRDHRDLVDLRIEHEYSDAENDMLMRLVQRGDADG